MPFPKLIVAGTVAALGLALAAAASADVQGQPFEPNDHASCAGLFSVVEHSSPGVWPTRPALARLVKQTAADQGSTPGQLYSDFARDHAGVYAQCNLVGLGVPLP